MGEVMSVHLSSNEASDRRAPKQNRKILLDHAPRNRKNVIALPPKSSCSHKQGEEHFHIDPSGFSKREEEVELADAVILKCDFASLPSTRCFH